MVTDPLGASQVIECPVDFLTSKEKYEIVPILSSMEKYWGCAGMCIDPKYYQFSDVDNGPPLDNCRDVMQAWLDSK